MIGRGERMQAIADHVYHVLIIAFVATTVIEVIVKAARKPRKKRSVCENATRHSGIVGGSGWIGPGGVATLTAS